MTAKKQKQPRRISSQYLENAALYYLQRYATSAANFRRVMRRKIQRSCTFHKTDPEEFYPLVDALVTRYIAAGLLNDKGFAEARVSSLRRQGRSKSAIVAKLAAKGLGRAEVEAALEGHDGEASEAAELAAAMKLAKKKKLGNAEDPKQRQKELAVLARAGFSFDIAQAALKYAVDTDDMAD